MGDRTTKSTTNPILSLLDRPEKFRSPGHCTLVCITDGPHTEHRISNRSIGDPHKKQGVRAERT